MTLRPETIVELRKERGWTQEKLAAVAGVSERTIQRAEKDGTCSLDTKMALSSVFGVPPSELTFYDNKQTNSQINYKISWGGVIGLSVLGLAAPILVLFTSVGHYWELVSFTIVILFTVVQSFMSYGVGTTYQIFDDTSWIVRTPSFAPNLAFKIATVNNIIKYAYLSGVIASVMAGLTLSVHAKHMGDSPGDFFLLVSRPLFYSVLFVELWFRPYKRKLESMLTTQQKE